MRKLGLTITMTISLVFTISCVSREVPVTETYYETENKIEYRTETYTDTENVVVRTDVGQKPLSPVSEGQNNSVYFVAEGSGTIGFKYYGYEIDTSKYTRSEIKINISPLADGTIGIYNLNNVRQISRNESLGSLSFIIDNSEVIAFKPLSAGEISFNANNIKKFAIFVNSWNAYPISSVKLVWSNDITEKRSVTKERQIPYWVPIQLEKQRTVIKTEKVPFWEIWKTSQ